MAIIKRGILGGFSKKIGNVVGSSWKGIAYMKSLPLSVANPRTSAQVAQRSKFANVSAFASSLLTQIVKPLWDRFAQMQSGYNAFVQKNIDLFANALPSPFADLIISQGKMAATSINTVVEEITGDVVGLTWVDDSDEGFKLATDVAYALVINETQNIFVGGSNTAVRGDLLIELELSEECDENDVLHVYLAFARADGTIVSNSSYKTVVVVP